MNEHPPKKTGPGRSPGPQKNAPAEGDTAVVALRMEELTVWAIGHAARMPRDHKFTLGDKLVETCLGHERVGEVRAVVIQIK